MKKVLFTLICTAVPVVFMTGCSDLQQPLSVSSETESFKTADINTISSIGQVTNMDYAKPSMIMSTDPQYQGNIEIVRRSGNSLQHLWSSGISANWTLEQTFGSNIRSNC